MVSIAPPRVRVAIAEKYVNMRTQSFTRTHARAVQEWIDSGRDEDSYWQTFRERMEQSERKWKRDVAQIDADPNMTFLEKRKAKDRLARIWPAWSQEQEDNFIRAYGDPRLVDAGGLQSLLAGLQDPDWQNAMRGGVVTTVAKHPWETKFYDALTAPRDGSVPVFSSAAVVGAPPPPATAAPQFSDDPEIQRMAEEFAKNVCPHCHQHFGKLNRNHTDVCVKRTQAEV